MGEDGVGKDAPWTWGDWLALEVIPTYRVAEPVKSGYFQGYCYEALRERRVGSLGGTGSGTYCTLGRRRPDCAKRSIKS